MPPATGSTFNDGTAVTKTLEQIDVVHRMIRRYPDTFAFAGSVDDILRSQGENDESGLETSYAMLGGFVWSIPVLGFIGTVQGLSQAIGQFAGVLQTTTELEQIKSALQGVTGGLATAFETTFQALVFALAIQLCLVYLKKTEEEFLDACGDYCLRNVVNRLRMMPFQTEQV